MIRTLGLTVGYQIREYPAGQVDSGIPSWGPDILLGRRTGNENARDATPIRKLLS